MATLIQKQLLMAKVKSKFKKVSPWIVPDPRTNSFNPTGLNKFKEAKLAWEAAFRKPRPVPPKLIPTAQLPVCENYQKIAEIVDTCPHELKQIMEHEINPENELVMSLFKKLIAAIKISEPIDFSKLNAKKQQIQEAMDRRAAQFKEATEQYNDSIKALADNIAKTEQEVNKVWIDICIGLVQNINTNPKIDSLGRWDQFIVKALESKSKKLAKVSSDGTITIYFASIKKLKPSDVETILEIANANHHTHEKESYNEFLWHAPIEDVDRYCWDKQREDSSDPEIHKIMGVIAERRGVMLVRSPYNGLYYADMDDIEEIVAMGDEIWGGIGFFYARDAYVKGIFLDSRNKKQRNIDK